MRHVPVRVAAEPSDADRSVKLTRTSNSGGTPGTNATLPFGEPHTGLITVDASVMRDGPYVSGNHWFSLPHVYNANGAVALSVAFNRGDIVVSFYANSSNYGSAHVDDVWVSYGRG